MPGAGRKPSPSSALSATNASDPTALPVYAVIETPDGTVTNAVPGPAGVQANHTVCVSDCGSFASRPAPAVVPVTRPPAGSTTCACTKSSFAGAAKNARLSVPAKAEELSTLMR